MFHVIILGCCLLAAHARPIFDMQFYDAATFDASYYSNIHNINGQSDDDDVHEGSGSGSGNFAVVKTTSTGEKKAKGKGWMELFRLSEDELSWAVSDYLNARGIIQLGDIKF